MIEKHIGKIERVSFGYGGYQDAQFGISVTLSSGCLAVGDFKGTWSLDIEHTEHCKWTEADRDKQYAELCRFVNRLMKDAKVKSVEKLKDVPVEWTSEGNTLKSWRILTEVL